MVTLTETSEDERQIGEVLIRYATGIDQRDWEMFRTCWTADAKTDYGHLGEFASADAITALMVRMHDPMGATYHRMSNFVIEVAGDRATVRSYVHGVLMVNPDDSSQWVDVTGHYDDVFLRTDDGWRIDRRRAVVPRMITKGISPATEA